MARTGRPKKSGAVYRFDFYYRYLPGEDPPELESLLKSMVQASGQKRRDIIRAALLGGARQAQEIATQAEDSESAGLFDDMLADF